MTKKERKNIIKWANCLTNEELEKQYYDTVLDSLGSQADDMYDMGYDISDILDRQRHEKYLSEKSDLLGNLCEKRGLSLWT